MFIAISLWRGKSVNKYENIFKILCLILGTLILKLAVQIQTIIRFYPTREIISGQLLRDSNFCFVDRPNLFYISCSLPLILTKPSLKWISFWNQWTAKSISVIPYVISTCRKKNTSNKYESGSKNNSKGNVWNSNWNYDVWTKYLLLKTEKILSTKYILTCYVSITYILRVNMKLKLSPSNYFGVFNESPIFDVCKQYCNMRRKLKSLTINWFITFESFHL